MDSLRRNQLRVQSRKSMVIVMYFTLRESRRYPAWRDFAGSTCIFCVACPDEALAKSDRGFAVAYYSFTLAVLDLSLSVNGNQGGASLSFAQSGYHL